MSDFVERLSRMSPEKRLYMLQALPNHLTKAGQAERLRSLLTNFGFMEAKVSTFGPQALIEDYDNDKSTEDNLRLIQNAIRLSANALVKDSKQLPGQLHGRLLHIENPGIQKILAQSRKHMAGLWLRPLMSSLMSADGPLLRTLEGHSHWVTAVAVASDGWLAISASGDETLKMWDVQTGQMLRTFKDHSEWIPAVAVTRDARFAVSGSQEGILKVWDIKTGQVLHTLKAHSSQIRAVAVTPDGRFAISGSSDTTLKIWDLISGQVLRTLEGHQFGVTTVAVPMHGRFIVSGGEDRKVKIWDPETGQLLRTLDWDSVYELDTFVNHFGDVDALAVTADGQRIISAYGRNNARSALVVWDINSGEALRAFGDHTGRVWAVALTADGQLAISGSKDRTLKVWDTETGRMLHKFEGHVGGVLALAVTPDGRRVISGSEDHTLKIWDIRANQTLYEPRGHSSPIKTLSLSSDGQVAISASDDGILKTWDTETGHELDTYQYALYDYRGPVRAWLPIADLMLLWSTDNRTADGRPVNWSLNNGVLKIWLARQSDGVIRLAFE